MNNAFFKKPQLTILLIMLIAACLRFPWLDRFPPALYSDEVSQGYNAYSILTTARDEYRNFLPISFRSFGDWKPPVPTYLMVPFIALFGLTPLAVRFPSALLGTLTVGITYFLVRELCKQMKSDPDFSIRLGIISACLLAISPWHISQSRSAMLIGVELFFFAAAIWLFLKGLSIPNWWYVSSLCFVMAIYSYYGMRLIVPLFIVFLLFYWRGQIQKYTVNALAAFGIGVICLLPLLVAFISNPDVVFGRAKTVSIFYDQGIALTVWDMIAQDGAKFPPMLTQIWHNKLYSYFVDIQRRFMQHFDMRFLFLVGDTQLPFQIPGMGVLYFIDGVLLLVGVRNITRKSPRVWWFLVAWAVVSIIPAALTFITPAANRTFTLVIPLMIVVAYGIISLFKSVPRRFFIPLQVIIIILYGLHFSYFIYNYTVVLPKTHADWWHYGYQQLYSQLHALEPSTQTIAISAKASVPYIFLLWYREWDPKIAQQKIHHNYQTDEFGFEHVDSVGNYSFPRHFAWEKDGVHLPNNSILVLTPAEAVGSEASLIGHIDYPNKEIAFKIYRITKNE